MSVKKQPKAELQPKRRDESTWDAVKWRVGQVGDCLVQSECPVRPVTMLLLADTMFTNRPPLGVHAQKVQLHLRRLWLGPGVHSKSRVDQTNGC